MKIRGRGARMGQVRCVPDKGQVRKAHKNVEPLVFIKCQSRGSWGHRHVALWVVEGS